MGLSVILGKKKRKEKGEKKERGDILRYFGTYTVSEISSVFSQTLKHTDERTKKNPELSYMECNSNIKAHKHTQKHQQCFFPHLSLSPC